MLHLLLLFFINFAAPPKLCPIIAELRQQSQALERQIQALKALIDEPPNHPQECVIVCITEIPFV